MSQLANTRRPKEPALSLRDALSAAPRRSERFAIPQDEDEPAARDVVETCQQIVAMTGIGEDAKAKADAKKRLDVARAEYDKHVHWVTLRPIPPEKYAALKTEYQPDFEDGDRLFAQPFFHHLLAAMVPDLSADEWADLLGSGEPLNAGQANELCAKAALANSRTAGDVGKS